jgi:hypothetical protein
MTRVPQRCSALSRRPDVGKENQRASKPIDGHTVVWANGGSNGSRPKGVRANRFICVGKLCGKFVTPTFTRCSSKDLRSGKRAMPNSCGTSGQPAHGAPDPCRARVVEGKSQSRWKSRHGYPMKAPRRDSPRREGMSASIRAARPSGAWSRTAWLWLCSTQRMDRVSRWTSFRPAH